jgi:hypothetical protein
MTHSLHREGSPDSLERDYVLFVYPSKGFNYQGSAPKVRHMTELIRQSGPVNVMAKTRRRKTAGGAGPGDAPEGVVVEGTNAYCVYDGRDITPVDTIQFDGTRVYSVFNSREKLKEALRRIKEADEGISVVVSGNIDTVREIAAEIGIDPHMVNLSLGIHGRTDRLPPADIREFTTMCGHGLVSPHLVRDTIRRLKTCKVSEEIACEILAKPCLCGIHNPSRSAELLRETAPLYTVDRW